MRQPTATWRGAKPPSVLLLVAAAAIAAAADGSRPPANGASPAGTLPVADSRLTRRVTLAFKAAAVSDLCNGLQSETSIKITAGPSVADEKVTLFCERMPLREVMQQLSRPFGYTWLRSGTEGAYRYELVQDLRSQLLEEELRNRERDAEVLSLDRQVQKFRPYLDLSPDEALEKSRSATPAEKQLLEQYAGPAWGLVQLYSRLSPRQQALLFSGQPLLFSPSPGVGEFPLPADVARGLLQSQRTLRILPKGETFEMGSSEGFPEGLPLTAVAAARPVASLTVQESELGQFTLAGAVGFSIGPDPGQALAQWREAATSFTRGGGTTFSVMDGNSYVGSQVLATGLSPAESHVDNAVANAALQRQPALRPVVTLAPEPSCGDGVPSISATAGPEATGTRREAAGNARRAAPTSLSPGDATSRPGSLADDSRRVTSADALAALHRATGMPIVADFYTRLYPRAAVSVSAAPLFDALNHMSDAMGLRWHKQGGWLQFRSARFYDDRVQEVPNRLLMRWAASRREHTALTLDDLVEISLLSDAQLSSQGMAEGARECWGLKEWDLACSPHLRSHLRFLAELSQEQRRQTLLPSGLRFIQLPLRQQQQFLTLTLGARAANLRIDPACLSVAVLRVQYTVSGGRQWVAPAPSGSEMELGPVPAISDQDRQALLKLSHRFNPSESETRVLSRLRPETDLRFTYSIGSGKGLIRRQVTINGGGLHTPDAT